MQQIIELIRNRKSTRTFTGKPLTEDDRSRIRESFAELENPFGVKVECRLLNAREYGATSPVVVGTNEYVGIKAPCVPGFELACGYSFEKFCLLAESFGVGTVMLAATISRGAFEKAMEVGPDEVMPVVSPVGYPAPRPSMREALMRKGLRADQRLPFGKLFFDGTFSEPLKPDNAGVFRLPLEMMRLAPSATNKQPWRAVVDGKSVHIYEKQTIKPVKGGDIQRLDVGIGICHFLLTLEAENVRGILRQEDPRLSTEPSLIYITTYTVS